MPLASNDCGVSILAYFGFGVNEKCSDIFFCQNTKNFLTIAKLVGKL